MSQCWMAIICSFLCAGQPFGILCSKANRCKCFHRSHCWVPFRCLVCNSRLRVSNCMPSTNSSKIVTVSKHHSAYTLILHMEAAVSSVCDSAVADARGHSDCGRQECYYSPDPCLWGRRKSCTLLAAYIALYTRPDM